MKRLKKLIVALSCAILPVLLMAQETPCVESYRECSFDPPEPNEPISIPCGTQGIYAVDGPIWTEFYACRGYDVECPGEGPCNIMTRTEAYLYYLTCSETEETTFCIKKGSSLGTESPTGTTCTGEFCDNGHEPIPDELISENTNPTASAWKIWIRR